MIESVRVYKGNRDVQTRYESGHVSNHRDINKSELSFILREDVKGFENEICITYRVDSNLQITT